MIVRAWPSGGDGGFFAESWTRWHLTLSIVGKPIQRLDGFGIGIDPSQPAAVTGRCARRNARGAAAVAAAPVVSRVRLIESICLPRGDAGLGAPRAAGRAGALRGSEIVPTRPRSQVSAWPWWRGRARCTNREVSRVPRRASLDRRRIPRCALMPRAIQVPLNFSILGRLQRDGCAHLGRNHGLDPQERS
jgi:hypothetical protein